MTEVSLATCKTPSHLEQEVLGRVKAAIEEAEEPISAAFESLMADLHHDVRVRRLSPRTLEARGQDINARIKAWRETAYREAVMMTLEAIRRESLYVVAE